MPDETQKVPAGNETAGGAPEGGTNPFAEAALPRFDEAVVEAGTSGPASDFLAKGGEGAFDEPIIDFTKPAAPTPPEGLDVIRAQTEKNAAKAAGREGFIPGLSSQDEQRIGEANDIRKTEFDRKWDAREKDWSVKDAEHTARETLAAQRAEGSSDSTVAAETTSTPSEAAPAASTTSETSAHDAYNARVDALPQERQDELSAAVIDYDRNGVLPDDPELRDLVAEGATLGPPPSEDPSLTAERPKVDELIVETPDAPMAPAAEAPLEETAGEEPAAAVSEATAIAEPEVPDAGIEVPAKANEVEEGSILIRKSDGKEFKVTGIEKYKDGNGASINYSSTDGSESGGGDANAMFTVGEWSRRIDAPAAAAGDGPGDPPDRPVAESAGSAGNEEQPAERDPFARAKTQRESGTGTAPINTEGTAAAGSAEGVDSGAAAAGSAEGVDSGTAAAGSAEGVDSGAAAVEPGAAAVDLAELTTRRDELEDQILSVTDPAEKDRINQELTSIDEQINNLQAATIEPEAAAVEPKRSARERALDFGLTEDEAHDMENIGDPTLRKPFSELTDVQKEFARQNLTDEEYQEYIKLTPSEMNDRLGLSTANGFPEAQPTPSDMRRGESKEQYEARKVAEAEAHEAREKEIFAGMTPEDIEAKKNEIRENWDKGASVTWTEKDAQIASHLGLEPTANEKNDISFVQNRMNEGATDLTDHEKYVRDKFGLKEKLDTTQEARQMERIEFAIRNGTASTEEIAKYNEYKNRQATDSKDVDIRNQLRDKLARVGLTKEEEAKLIQLEQSTKGTETPAQIEAQRKKKIENIATSIMLKFSRGEEPTPEEVALFQRLFAEQKMTEAGFTPEQARVAAREALKLESGKSQRESRRTREANEDMKKLMAFNLRLISQRNLAEQLNTKRKEVIEEAKAARSAAESAEPQDRMRLKGVEYGKYRQILSYNDQLAGTKYAAQRINAERIDLEQRVRRKTGVTGGVHAFGEWCGAKINNTITEITILAEEELPFGGISIPGSIQRGIISKGGYS